jgi:Dolichyl-phosphate-mannose-protein mannosyltransferase
VNAPARFALFALCLLPAAFLYLYGLDRSPVYLGLDEAHFAVHARALADTGRDLNGEPLPLFINLADPLGDQPALAWGASWYQPFLFYVIALSLKVLPFTEASARTPTALIAGVLNVALIYLVAMRAFRARWVALIAAGMLALTPVHLVLGRQALDYVCPLPFQLAWLWALLVFRDTECLRYAFISGLILGVGCYSYVSSWVVMPAFLAISWLIYRRSRLGGSRPFIASVCGFAIPLVPLVPWLWSHPQMVRNLLEAQSMSAVEAFGHGQPIARVLQRTVTTYWSYFNPAFLFLNGGASLNASTGQAGVFLLSIAVLLPAGLFAMFRQTADGRQQTANGRWTGIADLRWVLMLGLLVTPVPPTLKGMPHVIQRTLTLLPFVVLISACGASALWHSRSSLGRVVLLVLLALLPAQFAMFYADYLTEYRLRAASAYDRTAFVETARVLLDAESTSDVPYFYLTAPLYDVSAKWRFYVTKANRIDLLSRTRYFEGDLATIANAPPGSLAVVEPENPHIDAAVASGDWSIARKVADITSRETLTVMRRVQR